MNKRLLIVEDDLLLSFLLETYIINSGCCSLIAAVTNGKEALEIANKEKPDYILMDIKIDGDQDGIETAININKINDIPIIFTSANSDSQTYERAKKTNMFAFITKPIDKIAFYKLICSL